MADKVKFELVSPEKILVSELVDMVVVPGVEGNFGVLPGHAPLISGVRPGVIDVYNGGSIAERIFIAGGFAEVTPKRCTVLADQAMGIGDLDRGVAEAELAAARERLSSARDAMARAEEPNAASAIAQIERDVLIATAKLDALGTR